MLFQKNGLGNILIVKIKNLHQKVMKVFFEVGGGLEPP